MYSWKHLMFLAAFAVLWQPCPAPGDYGAAGGPLAKSGRKRPQSQTRTTQFPDIDEGHGDPSFQDPNAKINAAVVKQENWTAPSSANEKAQLFLPTPGEYGDMCCWEPHKNQLLNDIAKGQASKPFYGSVGCETCGDANACLEKCTKEKCNLVVWCSNNNSGSLFTAHKEKLTDLTAANFTEEANHNTYVRHCLRQYDITSSCATLVASSCPLCDEFIDFVVKYKKVYKGCEFIRRFEIFKVNKLKINHLNEQRVLDEDASFAVNQFADRTHEEFVKLFTGALEPEGGESAGQTRRLRRQSLGPKWQADPILNVSGTQTLQLRHNWVDYGVINPVRDQGECGSCYAFASSDLVGAQYAIDHQLKRSFTLAPQYLLNCFHEPAAFGCNGGRPALVMRRLTQCNNDTSMGGCEYPLETCLPYKGEQAKQCDKPKSCSGAPKIEVQKFNMVDISNDFLEKQKMAALLERGPLVVQIDASDAWQFYQEGILRSFQCTNKTNHAVLVVGYDFGTHTPGYIIKNTWNEDWGIKGFIYLEAGQNTCGIGQTVTYACTANCDVPTGGGSFGKIPSPTATPAPETPPGSVTTPGTGTVGPTAPPVPEPCSPCVGPQASSPTPLERPPTLPPMTLAPPGSPAPPQPSAESTIPCAGGSCEGPTTLLVMPPTFPVSLAPPGSPAPAVPGQSTSKPEPPPGYAQPAAHPEQLRFVQPPILPSHAANSDTENFRLLTSSDGNVEIGQTTKAVSFGNGCPISVFASNILADLAPTSTADTSSSDVVLKFTDTCRISECAKICEKAQCNYFVRASVTGLTNFYTVKPEKLRTARLITAQSLDSFVPQCPKTRFVLGVDNVESNGDKHRRVKVKRTKK